MARGPALPAVATVAHGSRSATRVGRVANAPAAAASATERSLDEGNGVRVILEDTVATMIGNSLIVPLASALESETFTESCCIGAIDSTSVYLRCTTSKRGIDVDLRFLDAHGIDQVIKALAASVDAQPRAVSH